MLLSKKKQQPRQKSRKSKREPVFKTEIWKDKKKRLVSRDKHGRFVSWKHIKIKRKPEPERKPKEKPEKKAKRKPLLLKITPKPGEGTIYAYKWMFWVYAKVRKSTKMRFKSVKFPVSVTLTEWKLTKKQEEKLRKYIKTFYEQEKPKKGGSETVIKKIRFYCKINCITGKVSRKK